MTLIFDYPFFKLSPHDSLRIKTLVDGFVKEGKLTKEPSRELHWVGVSLVKRMVDALFDDAVENGTRSWDVTILRVLSLVLTSALQCRSGDIHKHHRDEDDQPLPFIAYKDVRLKLIDGGREIHNLEARITIRNEKGHK